MHWGKFLLALALVSFGLSITGTARADAGTQDRVSYCRSTGGVLQERVPQYGTNGSNPLTLSGTAEFCQYTAKDGSQINVLLSTLTATKPTLAALAYYAKVQPGSCSGNPASCYCSLLGGSDLFGGVNAAGGGWVLATDSTDVLDTCIFPDRSSIDSFGLFYHSAGIIRGKKLGQVLKYKNPY